MAFVLEINDLESATIFTNYFINLMTCCDYSIKSTSDEIAGENKNFFLPLSLYFPKMELTDSMKRMKLTAKTRKGITYSMTTITPESPRNIWNISKFND